MKLLLAEDDIDFGNILSQYLIMSGFEVTLARNGREAWDIFHDARPDICILDIMMPEMDGYMLTRQIKADRRFAGVPVIMHSSLSGMSNQQLGMSVGVDEYVPKFEPQRLSQTLARLLSADAAAGGR